MEVVSRSRELLWLLSVRKFSLTFVHSHNPPSRSVAMSFITSWVTDKVSEYAKVGLQAGGSMAGNAVGGVGSMVENAGKTAGGGEF